MTDTQWSQPSLDLGPRPAVRLLLEVLLDPQEELGIVSIEVRTFPERNLIALLSRPAVPYGEIEAVVRDVGREFTDLLREHTPPFP